MSVTLPSPPEPWYFYVLPLTFWALAFGFGYVLGRAYAARGKAASARGLSSPLVPAAILMFLVHWLYQGHAWYQALFSPMLLVMAAAGLTVGTRRLLGYRRRHGLCLHCGYNLTGNTSGVCPECGTSLHRHNPPAG